MCVDTTLGCISSLLLQHPLPPVGNLGSPAPEAPAAVGEAGSTSALRPKQQRARSQAAVEGAAGVFAGGGGWAAHTCRRCQQQLAWTVSVAMRGAQLCV